ncbi:7-carboxy-7-deazaguanine synthase QueE [Streptomyces sp. JJ38]|uniref:7-carboxy-7-deazaguanine synthase QueE n=1 Tax=Streptomyces sp. JJ38 TaxID=2738128 RepID=UPI001C56D95A|nr:7-carboxy-7-deazaguanine synthase QueE [Streptomyces sp. JJ38]MBW1597252.1 7-carboxy-7-deazaguanine synthase QueE [Streptomyces sp. JJ38]
MLKISQLFGPTIQGEGSAAGRHCLFVRVFDCNLECTFCDTAYTWAVTDEKAAKTRSGRRYDRDDPAYGLKLMEPVDVLAGLRKLWDIQTRSTIIVVSGGEPMMQQQALFPVLQQLRDWGNEVHIETASSGNRLSKRYKPTVLAALHATDVPVPVQRVMVMPEGSDGPTNITTAQQIADAALSRGYGLSLRSHVLLWSDDPDR